MDVSNTPFTSRQAPSAGGTNREEPKPLLLDLDFSSTPITTTPITPAPATGGSAPSSSLLWWEQMGQEEEKPSSSSSTPMEEGSKKDGDGADEKMALEVEQGGEGGAKLGDEEDELARMQAEALRFWERKRQQEEEDMRVARLLEEELKDAPAPAPAPVPAPAPAPTTPAPASPNKRPYPTDPKPRPQVGGLSDSQLARQLDEEERKREEEDRRLAEELWKREEEEERERKKRKEWEETLTLVRTQAKAESDEELARALKEREDLMRELERLKAQAEMNAMLPDAGGDTHVSLTLDGIEYPERWENQKGEYQTFDVKKGSEEWNEIETHFQNSLGGIGAHITRIERNQNKSQWMFYYLRRQQVALKNKKDPNEKYLFHGSRVGAYEIILKDGFDHRVANMGGAIGAGVYFATHASTSTGYVTGGHAKKMLYCRVTLGSVGTGKSGIRRPPEKRGGGLHDSVGQVHGGNGMYVVFDNHQAFPEYTIHYR